MNTRNALPLDPSFGTDGKVELNPHAGDFRIIPHGMAAEQGGPILVGLSYWKKTGLLGQFGVAKLNNDGSFDTNFADRGIAVYPGPDQVRHKHVTRPHPLSNGKILLHCLSTFPNTPDQPFLARLNAKGSLDQSFGTNGIRTFPFQDHGLIDTTMTPMDDGRILLIGRREFQNGKVSGLISYLLEDGELDTSFGDAGILTVEFHGGPADNVHFGLRQAESFVLAGMNASQAMVRRFHPDGQIDKDFGNDGTYIVPSASNPNTGKAIFNDFLPAKDGGFIGVGSDTSLEEGLHSLRGFITSIDANGKQNPDFAAGQLIYTPDDLGLASLSQAMFDTSGRLVVIGSCQQSQVFPNSFILGRYSASGELDESYGDRGYGYIDFSGIRGVFRGATLQGRQGILVSAQVPPLGDIRVHILRVMNE